MTPKKAIFYGEFIKDGNGTRAAIAAGCPEKSAHVTAARWLKEPEMMAAIDAWRKRQVEKLEISAESLLQEIAKVAFADAGRLYDADGNRIPVHRLDDRTRAAVASVEDEVSEGPGFVTTRKQRIKMADKLRAAELLGKHLRLYGGEGEFSATVTPGPGGLPPDSNIKIVLVRPDAQ